MESGSWSEEVELMSTAMEVCEDKNGLLFAHLCNSYGCMESERAHTDVATPMMLRCLDIRKRLLPENHFELANIYNNYGNTTLQGYKTPDAPQRAYELHQKGMKIFSSLSEADQNEIMYIPYFCLSRSSRALGRYEDALRFGEAARSYVVRKFGVGSFFDAL